MRTSPRWRPVLLSVVVFAGLPLLGCENSSPTSPGSPSGNPNPNPNPPAPPTVTVATLTLADDEVDSGDTLAGTVTLSAAAPAAGTVVTLSTNVAAASVPASITIPAGSTSGAFVVTTSVVDDDVAVTVTAAAGGATRTATFALEAPGAVVTSFTSGSDDVIGGDKTPGTITLGSPAPAGGTKVALSSSDPDLEVPSSVTIPAGAKSATFEIETHPVTVAKDVDVTLTILSSTLGAAAVARHADHGAGADSTTLTIRLLPQPLSVTAVTPDEGAPETLVPVTITGVGFASGATVGTSSEDVTVSAVTVVNATTITATLLIADGAAGGPIDILVTVSGRTAVAEAAFTIVVASNNAPVAIDDVFMGSGDSDLIVSAPGVLDNDVDLDLDTLTAILVTDVTNGVLTLHPDGSFTFDPNCWWGTTTFTYSVTDGIDVSAPATVTIVIPPGPNPAPCAVPTR